MCVTAVWASNWCPFFHSIFCRTSCLKSSRRVEVFQPALRRDKRVVGAEQEAVLQVRCGFVQQQFRNVTGRPDGQIDEN